MFFVFGPFYQRPTQNFLNVFCVVFKFFVSDLFFFGPIRIFFTMFELFSVFFVLPRYLQIYVHVDICFLNIQIFSLF